MYIVSPGYLKAMGMRLSEGRDIGWADLFNNENVVIINETVARKLWPGEDPIGRIAVAGGQETRVIGVVADVRETSAEENAGWQMYLPATKNFGPEGAELVVRSSLPPATLAGTVMTMLRKIDPGQPATQFKRDSKFGRSCDIAAAILCAAGRNLRGLGIAAGFARNLWSHLIFRHTANSGDWYPNGRWVLRNCECCVR